MTVEELLAREAIRDTLTKYNTAGDRMRIADFVACFAEDGIFESQGKTPDQNARYDGRAAILAWQERWKDRAPEAPTTPTATFLRHHLTTCKIELTGPDTAQARTYFQAWADNGPDHAGYYLDEFRKVGEEWLIAHRRARIDWVSENSLFGSAMDDTR